MASGRIIVLGDHMGNVTRVTMSRHVTTAALLLAGAAVWAADERVGSGQAGAPAVAVVEGRVVDAATGQGLPNMPLRVTCTPAVGTPTSNGIETGPDGRFQDRVAPGRCAVFVFPSRDAGYITPLLEMGRSYDLGAGETASVLIRLWKAGAIDGRVLDESREPIAGTPVNVWRRRPLAGIVQWVPEGATARTDGLGVFRIPRVRSGSYRLTAPEVQLADPDRAIALAPGESIAGVEIRGRRLAAFRVSGRVTTPTGLPRDLTVHLDQADSPAAWPITVAATRANAEGEFVFAQVPQGAYRVRVDTSPRIPSRAPAVILSGTTSIVVDRDTENVSLSVRTGPEVRGKVTFDTSTRPTSPSVLIAFDPADGRPGTQMARADAGEFMARLLPDRYVVRGAGIPAGHRIKSVTLSGRDVTDTPLDLSEGPIDIVVTLTDRLTEINGVVRDGQGQVDGEATVLVFPADGRLWTGAGPIPRRVQLTKTSQRGNFSVIGLPPGEYFIAAVLSSELSDSEYDSDQLRRLAPIAARVILRDGDRLAQDLRRVTIPR
jgi:hypothetical protein